MTFRLGVIAFLTVALAAPTVAQQGRVAAGRVLAAEDQSPLVGVRVRVIGTPIEVISDSAGIVYLANLPLGNVRLAFERVGLESATITLAAADVEFSVLLQSSAVRLAPVVAEAAPAARQRFEQVAQTSTVTMEARDIAGTPGLAEADVIRAVQLLPGTVAKSDFSTSFNIRGGEGDQNLILLDGITVFNPTHMGGLFSTFDNSAVDNAELITGAFPAGYGGRLSSVLDISLRDGNPTRFSASGQISMLSTKVLVEGPIGSSGISYLASVRRTYADAIVNTFKPGAMPYYFADAVGKITVPTWKEGTLRLTSYWGRDVVNWEWQEAGEGDGAVTVNFDWGNRVAGLNLEQPVGTFLFRGQAAVSQFTAALGLQPGLIGFDNSARLFSASGTIHAPPVLGHTLAVGGNVESYRMNYRIASETLGAEYFNATYMPTIRSAFVDDQWAPFDWLLLRPGVRFESIPAAGFSGAAPRASAKLFLDDNTAVTGSVGRYYQALHTLRDQEIPFAVFEFWVGADQNVPVAQSEHVVAGIERWIRNDVAVKIEGYRKTFDNLVSPNREHDLKDPTDDFIPTVGDAWGADVLIRKYGGEWNGWIAYGLTNAERTAEGETFPPAHDRRHTLNIVVQGPGPFGADLGVRFGYGSSLPYTGFVGEWRHRVYDEVTHTFDSWADEPIAANNRNGERYPDYNRLDVSLRWESVRWGGLLKPYVQIVNLYNRRNVFVYSYDYDRTPATRTGVSQFPLLPSFGVEFQW